MCEILIESTLQFPLGDAHGSDALFEQRSLLVLGVGAEECRHAVVDHFSQNFQGAGPRRLVLGHFAETRKQGGDLFQVVVRVGLLLVLVVLLDDALLALGLSIQCGFLRANSANGSLGHYFITCGRFFFISALARTHSSRRAPVNSAAGHQRNERVTQVAYLRPTPSPTTQKKIIICASAIAIVPMLP